MKLRGETAKLRIETGRWCGLKRDERRFVRCVTGEKWKMQGIFTALYRLSGGENGDGEVDERDC